MNENTENPKPESDEIPQPTPPQEPTPMRPPSPPQETAPPPEYGESAPPIPPQEPTPQTETPQPAATGELTKDARMWGMFCHLSALAMFTSIPFANILGPLIIWLIKKEDFAFVNDQGKESLNFQISIAIYALVSSVTLCLPPVFFIIVFGLMIANLVFIIIASIKANEGVAYRYPCCLRFVK